MEEKTRGTSGGHTVWDTSKLMSSLVLDSGGNNDMVVCEILSRLPVKSLMRFKCVCKGWLYLIKEDSYFMDLHLSRSKERNSRCFFMKRRNSSFDFNCLTLDKFVSTEDSSIEGLGISKIWDTAYTDSSLYSRSVHQVLGPINGLICLVDEYKPCSVCICNISTREASPWITSTLLQEEKEKNPNIRDHTTTYKFGFDPTTKEHKVLCIWELYGGYNNTIACEILTLGNGTWRRIDEVPPTSLGHYYDLPCVYVNGSIYWDTETLTPPRDGYPTCIAAFDMGTEKFRMIQIPDFIRDQLLDVPIEAFKPSAFLLELHGRLGIVRKISANVVKLWTFDGNMKERGSTSLDNVGDGHWTEETITLPFPWHNNLRLHFYHVTGTCQIIIFTFESRIVGKKTSLWFCISVHLYNLEEKSFTEISVFFLDRKRGKLIKRIKRNQRGFNVTSEVIPNHCFGPFVESLVRIRSREATTE